MVCTTMYVGKHVEYTQPKNMDNIQALYNNIIEIQYIKSSE